MSKTIRWNVAVSKSTDKALRIFLANQGGGKKGDLSKFIEEAVRSHILELTAAETKAANANLNEDEISAIILEAIDWARKSSCES